MHSSVSVMHVHAKKNAYPLRRTCSAAMPLSSVITTAATIAAAAAAAADTRDAVSLPH
jgi:hypothetical protein